MEEFWIQLLAILTLLTQTCSASDSTELIGAVGGAVTFRSDDTDGNAALWSFGNVSIVTVVFRDPPQPVFYKEEFKTRFTVSEDGRALTISQLKMEDAGTYSVTIDGKKSTFVLLVYKELPDPTVTCESQECSDRVCVVSLSCSVPGAGFGNISYIWRMGSWLWDEGSWALAVNKSAWDNLEPLRCTAQNAVSSRSITVTIPEMLCPDAPSGGRVGIGVIAGIGIAVVFGVLPVVFCICKACCSALTACVDEW